MRKRRTHSPEFKARVAMEAISGRKTIQEIAADHAIHPIQVGQWKRQLLDGASELFIRGQNCPIKGTHLNLKVVQRNGDTTEHAAHAAALAELKAPGRFISSCSVERAKSELDKGFGLAFGILHHGPVSAPSGGGHYIAIRGYDASGWLVHDPYGNSIWCAVAGPFRAKEPGATSTTPLPTPIPAGCWKGPAPVGPGLLAANRDGGVDRHGRHRPLLAAQRPAGRLAGQSF